MSTELITAAYKALLDDIRLVQDAFYCFDLYGIFNPVQIFSDINPGNFA
jgi:hypothetical protein